MKISDAQFESIKTRLNAAIHELVFAVKHAEEDQLDDAATCLVTAQGTIEYVNLELVAMEEGRAR